MSENVVVMGWPVLIWLILSQLIYLGSLIPWSVSSMMAIMAFDSGVNFYNTLFVGTLWSYPVWVILFSVLAWVAYARQNATMAVIWTSVPLVLVIVAVALFFILAELGF